MPSMPVIAIVDDDADIPVAVSSLVRSLGYAAECFTSAEQLLDQSDIGNLSCVISDIHMPQMNGLQLARILSGQAPTLPVILMTGRSEHGLEARAREHGAVCLVSKPFALNELDRQLRIALGHKFSAV